MIIKKGVIETQTSQPSVNSVENIGFNYSLHKGNLKKKAINKLQ